MTSLATIILPGRAWLFPAIIAVAALTGALLWSARRGAAERWVAMVCGSLKFAAIAALAFCLLEPLWVSQRARPGANFFCCRRRQQPKPPGE